jgi:hypothetical protein
MVPANLCWSLSAMLKDRKEKDFLNGLKFMLVKRIIKTKKPFEVFVIRLELFGVIS